MPELRALPSVDQLLQTNSAAEWVKQYGHSLTVQALRAVLDEARTDFINKDKKLLPDQDQILESVTKQLLRWTSPSLVSLINATGVILHTNLGRAPLSAAALQAVQAVGQGYSNLEYDLSKGSRGSRLDHAEALLKRLTGAQAALVVNNNAAAVLLALSALAFHKPVAISRSQLVEIGGGFRVPEIMKQSGARLVEVGTTNRVHLRDYEAAIEEDKVAAILVAHRSNFRIVGFTSEPDLAEIVKVAHQAGIPVFDDLGSGALLDTARFGLGHEPTVAESLQSGVDLVCFSGDKLLGGPQAGIILGQADMLAKLRKHPLARAVRADKLCLAGLSATLSHYLKDEAEREIPIWRMIAFPVDDLRKRAERWAQSLQEGEVIPGRSAVGGGSLPDETLPTFVLALKVPGANWFVERLRRNNPPIIARLEDDRVLLDPRSVLPEQEEALLEGIRYALKEHPRRKQ